ncbi:MAG TPA: hypothetical protein VFK50_05555 [Sphingomicrobium sp.]|nr:hypothetical protein [Sphingomicrobium sp.]
MTLDRAEIAGTGAAIVFHVALIGALSIGLARVSSAPEPPAMDVEFVEEIGIQAAAPTPTPPASQAPEVGEAPVVEPAPAASASALPAAPRIVPTPNADAADRLKREIERSREQAARPVPPRPAPRVSRLGDDFLKGIKDSASASPKAAAPAFSASAMASIQQAIRRQIQPCADRQVNPGPGANRIRVTLNLRLSRGGRLVRPPEVVRTSGVDDENARYEDRVKDLAVAAYVGCAPLSGLPAELYQTAQGGWSNINMTYRLP